MLKDCIQDVKKRKDLRRIPRFEGLNCWPDGAVTTGDWGGAVLLLQQQDRWGESIHAVVDDSAQGAC